MNYENAKKIFIFVDESGDTGDPSRHNSSSRTFTINVALSTEKGVVNLETMGAGFKFFNFYKKELKTLRKDNLRKFSENFRYLTDVVFYGITVDKSRYIGPYLRSDAYPQTFFRNFILKIALEYVAVSEHLLIFQKPIEMVVDRYLDSDEEEGNLMWYFKKYSSHANIPKFLHVVQVDSRYCLPIQVLDVVQKVKSFDDFDLNFYKDIPIPASLLQNEKSPDVPLGPELFS